MPGIGHLAVGLAAARVTRPPVGLESWRWSLLLVAASSALDLDVLAFPLGVPYGAALGHRGATHSLVFAGLSGCALGLAARMTGVPALRVSLGVSLVMASHGVLDAFTDGGGRRRPPLAFRQSSIFRAVAADPRVTDRHRHLLASRVLRDVVRVSPVPPPDRGGRLAAEALRRFMTAV